MDRELLQAFRRRVIAGIEEDLAREEAEAEALRREVITAVRGAIEQARAEGRCGRAWLFGSFAWDRPGPRSDVDILVEATPDPDALSGAIWRVVDRPAHVVQLERAPDGLRERVLREGLSL